MKIDGGCSCGAIRIEGEADPEKTQICHCTDCQTSTGTAFRVSIPVPGTTFKMTGQPNYYLKTTADSGKPRLQAFCGSCASPIYSTTPGEGVQPSYMVRVGILRQRDQLVPRRQNWFRSARPWVLKLDAVPKNDKQAPA
ncbi:MAG TPA: GFA family protein [Xanthobacteraceae bacterium]|nr:GFA family protein [Xanthobacteraceae bacterium]